MKTEDVIEVLKKRRSDFKLQKYESNEIDTAIDIITRLVPPDYFASQFKSEALPEITDVEMNREANKYGKLVKENIDGNGQDYGVEENASLDFIRGANWYKTELKKRNDILSR